MPRRKFIDKKNAVSFQLVSRSGGGNTDHLPPEEQPAPYMLRPVAPPNLKLWKNDNASQFTEDRERFEQISDDEHDGPSVPGRDYDSFVKARDEKHKKFQKRKYKTDDYEFGEYGFPDDGYDYTKHFSKIGGGFFVEADTDKKGAKSKEDFLKVLEKQIAKEAAKSDDEDQEIPQPLHDFLDAPEVPDSMVDEDIARELEKDYDEVPEDEQLEDNFFELASGRVPGQGQPRLAQRKDIAWKTVEGDKKPAGKKMVDGQFVEDESRYDYDLDNFLSDDDDEDDEYYDSEDDDDDLPDLEAPIVVKESAAQRKRTLLDERFEYMSRAYGDEHIGELDEEDPATRGTLDLSQFGHIMDEFLVAQRTSKTALPEGDNTVGILKGLVKEEAHRHKLPADEYEDDDEAGGLFSDDEDFSDKEDDDDNADDDDDEVPTLRPSRPQRTEVVVDDGVEEEPTSDRPFPVYKQELISRTRLPDPEELDDQDEVYVPAKYFDPEYESDHDRVEVELVEEEDQQWDCVSILSTLTNTDNIPVRISEPNSVKLSKKSGMPLGVLESRKPRGANKGREESGVSAAANSSNVTMLPPPNMGEKRFKNESKEEKAARKKAIKDSRKENRERKKDMRVAFKTEQVTQQSYTSKAALSNKTVVKF